MENMPSGYDDDVQERPDTSRQLSDYQIERALLGALVLNNESYYKVSNFLAAHHFTNQLHAKIYETIESLIEKGHAADAYSISTNLLQVEDQEVDAFSTIAELMASAPTIINATYYGQQIFDLAQRRTLVEIGNDMVNGSYDLSESSDPAPIIELSERALFALTEKDTVQHGFINFSDSLARSISAANVAMKRDGQLAGLPTGMNDFDHKLGGLQASDLIIIAGRPGMGKSAFATTIGYNLAKTFQPSSPDENDTTPAAGGRVGIFSLEMSAEQLAARVLSAVTRITSSDLRRGTINVEQFNEINQAATEIRDMPIYIDETGGITLTQLITRARRLKRTHSIDLLIIDYLQLIRSGNKKIEGNRVQEITEISVRLKGLAKELNIPVIALSQLSRQVESRDDKRPILSDLRESGSIEQDADVVIFIYREEYYLQNRMPPEGDSTFADWQSKMETATGRAEIIIAKHRHGPTSKVALHFNPELTLFSDPARDDDYPY